MQTGSRMSGTDGGGGKEWNNCKYTWKVLDYKRAEVVKKDVGNVFPLGGTLHLVGTVTFWNPTNVL
jgi:hypothetical protein